MIIDLYTTNSPKNKINKDLSNKTSIDCKLTENCDIINPKVIINGFVEHNYCYIPQFKRYYYITNINIGVGGFYTIELKVDVLMSFKNDILNSSSYIESRGNEIYTNSSIKNDLVLSQRTENITLEFPNGFLEYPKYILVTKGVL